MILSTNNFEVTMQENQIKQAIERAYQRFNDKIEKTVFINDGLTSYIAKMNDLYNMKRLNDEPTFGYCEFKTLTLLRTSILALFNIDEQARNDNNTINLDDLWAVTENLRLLEVELIKELHLRYTDVVNDSPEKLKQYLFEELSRLYSISA